MNPFDLLQGPALIVLFPLFMLALLRIIAPDGVDLDGMLRLPVDREWPRGVQEEEPVHWRVELLSRRNETPGTATTDPAIQANAPVSTGVRAPRGA